METIRLQGSKSRTGQRLIMFWNEAQVQFAQIDQERNDFARLCARDLRPDFRGEAQIQVDAQGNVYLIMTEEDDLGGEMPDGDARPVHEGREDDVRPGAGGEV